MARTTPKRPSKILLGALEVTLLASIAMGIFITFIPRAAGSETLSQMADQGPTTIPIKAHLVFTDTSSPVQTIKTRYRDRNDLYRIIVNDVTQHGGHVIRDPKKSNAITFAVPPDYPPRLQAFTQNRPKDIRAPGIPPYVFQAQDLQNNPKGATQEANTIIKVRVKGIVPETRWALHAALASGVYFLIAFVVTAYRPGPIITSMSTERSQA